MACHLFKEKDGICSKAANTTGVLFGWLINTLLQVRSNKSVQWSWDGKQSAWNSPVWVVALVSVADATPALGSGVSVIRRPALQAPILSTLRIFALRIMETQVELLTVASWDSPNRALRSRGNKLTAPSCPQSYVHPTLRISHSDWGESFGLWDPVVSESAPRRYQAQPKMQDRRYLSVSDTQRRANSPQEEGRRETAVHTWASSRLPGVHSTASLVMWRSRGSLRNRDHCYPQAGFWLPVLLGLPGHRSGRTVARLLKSPTWRKQRMRWRLSNARTRKGAWQQLGTRKIQDLALYTHHGRRSTASSAKAALCDPAQGTEFKNPSLTVAW